MNYVVLDFETANECRTSVCSIGMIIVDNDRIVDTYYKLVKPRPYRFDPYNVMIHGITRNMVADAPEFCDLWDEIRDIISDKLVIAHNASFDMSVLRYTLDCFNIEYPCIDYFCTYRLAREALKGMVNYRLNTLCDHYSIDFEHHDALEDARAAHLLLQQLIAIDGHTDISSACDCYTLKTGSLFPGGYSICGTSRKPNYGIDVNTIEATISDIDEDNPYYHKKVAFTGTLDSMTRKQAMQLVVNAGGEVSNSLTKDTNFLVMGMQDLSKLHGQQESSKMRKAKQYIAKGNDLQIISEDDFLRMLPSGVVAVA